MANKTDGIQKRIDRGIEWLDKNVGRRKWAKKIDLDLLDLSDPNTCMIGEVLGDFDELEGQYGVNETKAASMGFYQKNEGYGLLTQLWKCTLLRLGIGVNTIY